MLAGFEMDPVKTIYDSGPERNQNEDENKIEAEKKDIKPSRPMRKRKKKKIFAMRRRSKDEVLPETLFQ